MSAPNNQPIGDADLERFRAYLHDNPSWGSLHTVLEDGNERDGDVEDCINYARKKGDVEGEYLGQVLLKASKSQRLNLTRRL